jgi:hypothetical protein
LRNERDAAPPGESERERRIEPGRGVRDAKAIRADDANAAYGGDGRTPIQVGDYDTWRPMFDQDLPRAREKAKVQRVFRDADDPNHVFILLEFTSLEDAHEARRRLVESGVLDRFEDKHGPNVVQEADHAGA